MTSLRMLQVLILMVTEVLGGRPKNELPPKPTRREESRMRDYRPVEKWRITGAAEDSPPGARLHLFPLVVVVLVQETRTRKTPKQASSFLMCVRTRTRAWR